MRLSFFIVLFGLIGCQNTINKRPNDSRNSTPVGAFQGFPTLPQKMTFAGETIQLMDEDLRERLDRELMVTAFFHSATTGGFKRAHRYFPMIERILKEEGVPDDFKYLALIESNLVQAVSPVGAQGFWQFMPETARIYSLEMSNEVDERLDIEKSTRAACTYLKKAKTILGDWILTTASYNRGLGGVQDDMRWQHTTHYFDTDQNSETARYVFRVLAMKLIFENPEAYGYFPTKMELYEPFQTKSVTVNQSIPNLADWAVEHGVNIKIVRKLNPWLLGTKLTIKNKTYTLLLPATTENLKPYLHYNTMH
jgi:membrane-bound lytic murein transglycosylase D